jgi:hypothetical protein
MPLPAPLHDTLGLVAQAMRPATDDWWLIGSAAVALSGAGPVTAADVDVLLSDADMDRVAGPLGLSPRVGAPDRRFCSARFVRWSGPPLPVELMSELKVRTASGWAAVAPRSREAVTMGGAPLFIPERAELRQILLSFGRPKDHARAALLAE